jgi:23S rRNA pseudouridine2605 synthase
MWLALYKPAGYLVSRGDTHGRRTLYALLPSEYRGLFHVGRLDRDSEGLILLTNEGETGNRMLHPRHGVDRVYEVDVDGSPGEATLSMLRKGVRLEDGLARATHVERLDAPGMQRDATRTRVRLTLREGRKREVRRMMDAVGHPVRRLVRVRYGPIELGDLAPGQYRELTQNEVRALRRIGGGARGD